MTAEALETGRVLSGDRLRGPRLRAIRRAGGGAYRLERLRRRQPKECYIVSPPTSSAATRDGQPTEVQRGDIRLFVAFRPGENVSNEVSFTGGYPFREGSTVTLAVGGDSFTLTPGAGDAGEWAWTDPSDDSRVVAALRRGASAKVSGTSQRGTTTEDTFSLSGFTAAVEDAAARCQ